jgi:hypothetical protein
MQVTSTEGNTENKIVGNKEKKIHSSSILYPKARALGPRNIYTTQDSNRKYFFGLIKSES